MKTREMGVQYGDGGEKANPGSINSWEFGAHAIVGTVCTNDTDVNVRTFPFKYVNVTVSRIIPTVPSTADFRPDFDWDAGRTMDFDGHHG